MRRKNEKETVSYGICVPQVKKGLINTAHADLRKFQITRRK